MPQTPVHPNFKEKNVMRLYCQFCRTGVCERAMKAVLLADNRVELYSTDATPERVADAGYNAYQAEKCKCIIKDIACLCCGNVLGYLVIFPCQKCLESCNNGHYLMFYSAAVHAAERLDWSGNEVLVWGSLDDDEEVKTINQDEIEYLR